VAEEVEVAGAAAEKAAAVASAGAQTGGVEETGEREDRVIERERERMAGWIRWEG